MTATWYFFWVVWGLAILLILAYGWVILFGAPFVPTLKKQRKQAIKLMDLKPDQLFVDLGCGDGSLLVLAAERGWQAVGYELNPFLALYAWLRTRRYGCKVKVICSNFWKADISKVDGIFIFLIGHYMAKFDDFINSQPHKKLKVVSNAFEIPGRKPVGKLGPLLVYEYPAKR